MKWTCRRQPTAFLLLLLPPSPNRLSPQQRGERRGPGAPSEGSALWGLRCPLSWFPGPLQPHSRLSSSPPQLPAPLSHLPSPFPVRTPARSRTPSPAPSGAPAAARDPPAAEPAPSSSSLVSTRLSPPPIGRARRRRVPAYGAGGTI